MKKKALLAVSALLLLSSLNFSCKKALENVLTNATYEDAYWKTASDVEGGVLGAYTIFRSCINRDNAFFYWGDGPVGLFGTDDKNAGTVISGGFRVAYRWGGTQNWDRWYQIVALCNLVLAKTPDIPDAKFAPGQKNYLLGEAYFLRAISYFYMTRVWGGLPLQLTAVTSADSIKAIGRTDEKIIMQQVIKDASMASSLLTWGGLTQYGRIRASKAAALALLAHANAWTGNYGQTVSYTDSLISRTDLINLQPQGQIAKVFTDATVQENIFIIPSRYSDNEGNKNTVADITIGSDFIPGFGNANPTFWLSKDRVNALYTSGDTRLTEFVGFRNNNDAKPNLLKYKDVINIGTGGNFDMYKQSNIVVFRLADIILLKAEALYMLGREGEANTALQITQIRSGLTPVIKSGPFLQREILLERQRELIGEGQNYYDMIRNSRNYATTGLSFYPAWMTPDRFSQKGYLWPIGNVWNRLIAQNQWWQNH